MKQIILKQSRRDTPHKVQATLLKAESRSVERTTIGRNVWMATVTLLLVILSTACNKPEKQALLGTWQWKCTSGGIGGWLYSPETEGFTAEIVFKGGRFTFYKDGEKVTSGPYQIVYDVDETIYTNKGGGNEPFYSWFSFHIPETQCKMIAEATCGKVAPASPNVASLGYSEAEGPVFSICDNSYDGFAITFVKKQ